MTMYHSQSSNPLYTSCNTSNERASFYESDFFQIQITFSESFVLRLMYMKMFIPYVSQTMNVYYESVIRNADLPLPRVINIACVFFTRKKMKDLIGKKQMEKFVTTRCPL